VVFGKIVYWFKKKVGFCLKGEGIFKGKEWRGIENGWRRMVRIREDKGYREGLGKLKIVEEGWWVLRVMEKSWDIGRGLKKGEKNCWIWRNVD
jgi:hypothetical protein